MDLRSEAPFERDRDGSPTVPVMPAGSVLPAVPVVPAGSVLPAVPGGSVARSWRVSRALLTAKLVAAVVFAGLAALAWADPTKALAAAAGAAVTAAYAGRDLIAPVRLAADPAGVTLVAGYAGRRRLAWSQIQRVRVDERTRLGLRAELLEIDAGESLHLFSTYDLDAPVVEVADELARIWELATT